MRSRTLALVMLHLLAISACAGASPTGERVTELQRACESGKGEQCNSLGLLYSRGRGVSKDYLRAARYFERGCELGSMLGCVNLGLSLELPLGGVKGDPKRAAELYKKACDSGTGEGCLKLGAFYDEMGPPSERDFAKAARFYERACTLRASGACVLLAEAYRKGGESVGGTSAEAARLLEEACREKEPIACIFLARMCRGREGSGCDATRAEGLIKTATKVLEESCKGGDAGRCFLLGAFYDDGEMTAQDHDRARLYYRHSCEYGNVAGCELTR